MTSIAVAKTTGACILGMMSTMMTFVHTEKGKKMSRYINANALKKRIDKEIFRHDTIDHVFQIIDDAPSIDIVRCKDCISNDINCGGEDNWCLYFGHDVYNDDFCSYGERKEDE